MAGRRRLALAAACVAAVLPGAGAEAAAAQAACAAEEAEEAAALRTHLVQLGRRPWRGPARAAAAADGPRPHLGGAASLAGRGAEAPPPQAKTFLWMSDAHADPLYGSAPANGPRGQSCKKNVSLTEPNRFGVMGCDPPYSLLRSAAKAAANSTPGVEFVVYTGDFVRHGTEQFSDPWENVTDTIREAAGIIQTEMAAKILDHSGGTQAFGTLGNDDSPADYLLNVTTGLPQNPWVSSVGAALASAGVMSSDTASSYSYGGFFEDVMGGLTVVNINTIVYSVAHIPVADPLPEDPFNQFAWLRSRLRLAAEQHRMVWIVGHIPPGIETYGYSELWDPAYVEKYLDIVQDPVLGPTVAAQFFGHVHKEEFRILPNAPPGSGPIILTSAISPVYINNPMFRFFEYDPVSQRPLTYKSFFAEVPLGNQTPQWRLGYDLLNAYGVLRKGVEEAGALLHSHVESLADRLADGLQDWQTYASWYSTRARNDLTACSAAGVPDGQGWALNQTQRLACREQYRCAMTVRTQGQFNGCVASSPLLAASSGWRAEGQKLAAPLLRRREDLYYAVQHAHWAAELSGELGRVAGLREALSSGAWQEVEGELGRVAGLREAPPSGAWQEARAWAEEAWAQR